MDLRGAQYVNDGTGNLRPTEHFLGWGKYITAADIAGDSNMEIVTTVGSTTYGRVDYHRGTGLGQIVSDVQVASAYTAEQSIARLPA